MKRWIALSVLALALPATAHGEAVGVYDAIDAEQVALAGPDILVARDTRRGLVVDAVPRAGGAPRTLLSLPSARLVYAGDALVASAERVVVLAERRTRRGSTTASEVYSGPPSGPLQLVWRSPARGPEALEPGFADVAGDRAQFVTVPAGFGRGLAAWTFGAGAPLARVPWASDGVAPVAVSGDYAAAFADGPRRVVLADRATGAELASGRLPAHAQTQVDVTADGRLVSDSRAGLFTLRPGTAAEPLARTRTLARPRFAGDAIAAVDERLPISRPVLLRPDGSRGVLGGPTRFVAHHAADAQGVAWLANGCVRYAPIDGSPAPTAPSGDPCPRTEISLYTIDSTRLRGRTVRVRVTCIAAPSGTCRGTLLIKRGLGRNGPVLSRGPFSVPAGVLRRVPVRLNRRALRAARRDGTFQLGARIPGGRVSAGGRGDSELTVKGV